MQAPVAFKLETLFVGFDRLALRWSFGANILFPVRYTVWRSENATGGFVPVLQDADQLNYVDSINNQSKFKPLYYYVTYEANGQTVKSNIASVLNAPNSDVLRLQKRERFQLAKFDGVPAFLYTRRRSGPPCPRCTTSNAAMGDLGVSCQLCFGTGIEGGYYPPTPIYIAKQVLNAKGASLMDSRVKESANSNLWTSNWTITNPEDVIVEMVPPNVIWRVTGVQMSERRRAGVRQLLTTNEADKGGAISFLPIPVCFEFPPRETIFIFSWTGENFDEMFQRLTDEYNAANPRSFAAAEPAGPATQQLASPPGQQDAITGFFG